MSPWQQQTLERASLWRRRDERESDSQYLLLPGPRASNCSCFRALASLPSGAPETPEFLVLKISTWANVFPKTRPMVFSVLTELSLSLLASEGVGGTGDKSVLIFVPGRGKDLP